MNFQFYQAPGLVPTGAMSMYGTGQTGPFIGQPIRGLLGAPAGLLAPSSAVTAGASVGSALHASHAAAAAAAMLRGMAPPGFASQQLGQPGPAVVAGVASKYAFRMITA